MSGLPPPPFTLNLGTALSLGLVFSLLPLAQILAAKSLPKNVSRKLYWIWIWHCFDFLTHTIVEGSYLFHCFFSYVEIPSWTSDYPHPASRGSSNSHEGYFIGKSDQLHGAIYSKAPMARLWQEYAKADSRWGVADTTVISLELLTVGLAGPAALYVCYLIAKSYSSSNAAVKGKLEARLWFVATMLATGELYGGFMTFAPQWLSENKALATDDMVYLWFYLVFFNVLWVFIPFWVLCEAYVKLTSAFTAQSQSKPVKKIS